MSGRDVNCLLSDGTNCPKGYSFVALLNINQFVSYHVLAQQKELGISLEPLLRDTSLIYESSALMIQSLPKRSHLLIPSTLGVKVQCMNLGRTHSDLRIESINIQIWLLWCVNLPRISYILQNCLSSMFPAMVGYRDILPESWRTKKKQQPFSSMNLYSSSYPIKSYPRCFYEEIWQM